MKYKLTNETREYLGRTLHRIEALEDFGIVEKGTKGGWIEKEENLSQEGSCWVYENAKVYGDAWVCGDARIYENAEVCGDAGVYGDAKVFGNARVYGNAEVYGNINLDTGNCFAHKYDYWDITEVPNGEGHTLLIRDYKKPSDEMVGKKIEVKIDGKTYTAVIKDENNG